MAQINDLLVLGNSNLLGSVNILGDLIQKGEKVVTISALSNISYNDLLDLPTSLKNPNLLIFTGASTETYDGSTEVSINIVGWAGTGTNAERFNNATSASGDYSHAEGQKTTASGESSHAEGNWTTASGKFSHAEGNWAEARGNGAHAEGASTTASGDYSHVQGKWNIEDTANQYAHIVGNGAALALSNAHTLGWDGTAWFQGDVYTGSSSGTNKDSGSIRLARINELPGAASTSAAGIVKIGSNISVSSGTISVPAASDTTAGVTVVYPKAKCTTYTSDSGTVTPAAVKQAVEMFGITLAAGGTFDSGATAQKDQAQLKWATVNSKTPFIGYATDQNDGTFVVGSITGTTYQTGLAIGGGSGNLLWKGVKVATTSDIPSTHAASKITAGTFAGQVVAKSDAQAPGTSLLRNSKLVSTSTNPTVNGEICWQYE